MGPSYIRLITCQTYLLVKVKQYQNEETNLNKSNENLTCCIQNVN